MKQIGMMSVTLNAVNPMVKYFNEYADRFSVLNYLDEGLQQKTKKEGEVSEESVERMASHIDKAIADGADALLFTCTVFSPFVGKLSERFGIPIIGADIAMLETAAAMRKKTAILCTFPVTIETSSRIFEESVGKYGFAADYATFLLEDAARAIGKGDVSLHNKLIAQKAQSLSHEFDLIVLAQISMAGAAELLMDNGKPVLTSPQCAIEKLKSLFP